MSAIAYAIAWFSWKKSRKYFTSLWNHSMGVPWLDMKYFMYRGWLLDFLQELK